MKIRKYKLDETIITKAKESILKLKAQANKNVLLERFIHDYETAMQFLYNVQTNNIDEDEIESQATKILGLLLGRLYLNVRIPGRFTNLEKLAMLSDLRDFIEAQKVA